MNLINEFLHDSYVEYRRWRAARKTKRDSVPRNVRILDRIGVTFLVGFFLGGIGVIGMFAAGLWVQALILAPLLAIVLVVWYRFLLWFENKHVSIISPVPHLHITEVDREPRDW